MTAPINLVIPTRERADTLFHTLATAIAQDCDRLLIWVSDNHSSPATRDAVESFRDPRIRYLNTGKRLSMSHNFEFALDRVESGWVAVIGDDDGLLPDALEPAVARLEDSGLLAMGSETGFYTWPNVASPNEPILAVPLSEKVAPVESRLAVASMLRLSRHKIRLPQTYTGGIVHLDLCRAIKARSGSFYRSQIPDIYSSYAITAMVDRFLYSKAPFALAGRSSHSTGSALFKMEKNVFLDEGLIPFHPDFPDSDAGTLTFSMPAIQFESYTQATALDGSLPPLSRQRMLEVILANAGIGREVILAWGHKFAALHGLDYATALARAPGIARETRLVNGWRAFNNLFGSARLYAGDALPHANVHEASQTAAVLRAHPPGRFGAALRTLARRLQSGQRVGTGASPE